MAEYLDRVSTQVTGTELMDEASAVTILDTATFPNQNDYQFTTLNAVMVANKDGNAGHTFTICLVSGGVTYGFAPNQYVDSGQTWTSRPEGFLNLKKGDKLVMYSNDVGQFFDVHCSYLYVDAT